MAGGVWGSGDRGGVCADGGASGGGGGGGGFVGGGGCAVVGWRRVGKIGGGLVVW